MIFSFRTSSLRNQEMVKPTINIDHERLIDISLVKLSQLQCMGKGRTERHIIFVIEVLQHALFMKSIKDHGEMSVADLVYYFEQEIYTAMMRSNVERLPRLWIDLPGGLEKAKTIKSSSLPFRIKASFTKNK